MITCQLASVALWLTCVSSMGAAVEQDKLSYPVVALDSRLLAGQTAGTSDMLKRDMWARLTAVNERETQAWEQVRSLEDWERFRDARLEALRLSLGSPPSTPLEVEVTRSVAGEGYRIECLVISGRPGLPITANLYVPDPPQESMPGIVICTSHHNPKTQGELQDMGMTWARSGTMVLVPDNLGHGERRQQPFAGREDYRWRYNEGIQLYLVGESLVGWMVADLRRCLDVLVGRPGADPKRIILMGSVAGGGEPAAIAAALDPRVACSIPFNFGSGYTVSESEMPTQAGQYNWANWGDWESTRVLRLSGRDGFLPWVIVAAAAPRPLIFAKEFAFDADKDPAWQRIRKVYEFYGANDRVAEVHGYGSGSQPPSAASHANNVGPPHRKGIYPLLAQWLNMPVPREYQKRQDPGALACMTPKAESKFGVRKLCEVAAQLAGERLAKARQALDGLPAAERKHELRRGWAERLGNIEPKGTPAAKRVPTTQPADVKVEKVLLTVEQDVLVPMVLLAPGQAKASAGQPEPAQGSATRPARRPVVIGISQQGKGVFLARRADEIAGLVRLGCVVCLPDVRGTGETSPGPDRDFAAAITEIHSQELKMGQTLLGSRLRDLRSVMQYLRTRDDIDASRMALWGESFAPTNPQTFVDPPLHTEFPPYHAEPLGAMLAVLGGLFEDDVKAVVARGGLTGYAAVLDSWAFYVPHDAIVPGALQVGDFCDLAAALAPLPVRLEGLVDGRNRAATREALDSIFGPTRKAYQSRPDMLTVNEGICGGAAAWLSRHLAADQVTTNSEVVR